jgi:glycosyltransferase involved in cell wall biosynthesis
MIIVQKVLVIIPAYNEAANIADVITSVKEEYPEFDILVVNDGSIDNTGKIAESTNKAKVVNLPFNIGIGGSVQTGFEYAKKTIIP